MSRPTSRWLTMLFLLLKRNSIGSSIVRMWPDICWLRHSIIAASVVLLPVPVAPTIRMRPRFSITSCDSSGGMPSESSEGMSNGMQRNTAAIEPRCLKADSRKLPTRGRLIADVELAGVFQFLHLLGRQQLGQQLARLVGGQQLVGQLQDLAVDLDQDRRVGRHVHVRGVLLRHQAQHALEVVGHAGLHARLQARSSSLMEVLARVCASTFFTMTAQYRLWLPSAPAGCPTPRPSLPVRGHSSRCRWRGRRSWCSGR